MRAFSLAVSGTLRGRKGSRAGEIAHDISKSARSAPSAKPGFVSKPRFKRAMNRPLPQPPVLPVASPGGAAREIARSAFARADDYDHDNAFPTADVENLRRSGLLSAVLPRRYGGAEMDWLELCEVLRRIGSGSLPLGRLYEGHVNALGLAVALRRAGADCEIGERSARRAAVRRLEYRRRCRIETRARPERVQAGRAQNTCVRRGGNPQGRW